MTSWMSVNDNRLTSTGIQVLRKRKGEKDIVKKNKTGGWGWGVGGKELMKEKKKKRKNTKRQTLQTLVQQKSTDNKCTSGF